MNWKATLTTVSNRESAPVSFLEELVSWGKTAPDEIFAPRKDDPGEMDIYTSISSTLGPWMGLQHRKAAMLEVLRVLAGFESSWDWSEGHDTNNPSENNPLTKSAGAFQVSANSMVFGADLKALINKVVGTFEPNAFRDAMRSNHPLAIEYAARLLRHTARHNGPVKRGEIHKYLNRAAVQEFETALGGSAQQASPALPEPLAAPSGTPSGFTVGPDGWLVDVERDVIAGGLEMVPICLVQHFTSGASARSSIESMRDQGLSAHLVIERNGEIIQCRPFNLTCAHAGKSRWVDPKTGRKWDGLNQCAIGIEIANTGDSYDEISWARKNGFRSVAAKHRNGGPMTNWEVYTPEQRAAVIGVSLELVRHYNLHDITGHDCIAPERKSDPGPAFDGIMQEMRSLCGFSGLPVVHRS